MKRITGPAALAAGMLIAVGLAALAEAARPPRPPAGLAATASVSPTVQFLNDTVGSTFTFTIRNGGTLGIGAVEIARPSTAWTMTACPMAPSGWTAAVAAATCRYKSGPGAADNLAPGVASADFQLVSTTTGGTADRTGTWLVSVSSADSLDDPSLIATATAEGGGLATTAFAFEVVDVMVGTAAAGSPCPNPAPGDHGAFRGSTQTILVCGRNRSTIADAAIGRRSSLGGSFLATPGTFGAAVVPGNSARVVLARWTGATIGDIRAVGHSITVKLASGNSRSTPPTRLDDACPATGEWCLANGGYKIVNRDPVAVDDATFLFRTDEDTPFVTPSVLDNDSDPDGDPLAVVSLDASSTLGAVTSNGDGTFAYDPAGRFEHLRNGELATDTFRYSIGDGFGGGASALVTITIVGRDDPLDARDDAGPGYATDEKTAFTTPSVLANDTFSGGEPASLSFTQPAGGTVSHLGGGLFRFDPDGDFDALLEGESRTPTFTYTIGDGTGASDTATVAILVTGRGHRPVAVDDTATGSEDDSLTIPVLANDSDPDGDLLTIVAVVQPSVGAATIEGSVIKLFPGAAFQDLAAGQSRTVAFEYKIDDFKDGTDRGDIIVTVEGRNDAPVALDDSASTGEDTSISIDVLANDLEVDAADDLSIASVDGSLTVGAVSIVRGQVRYDPAGSWDFLAPGEVGTTSFTYLVADGSGGFASATVVVHVDGADDAPIAADDAAATDEDTSVDIPVLANDTDPDGSISIVSVGPTSNGGVASINGSMVKFAPNADFQDLQTGEERQSSFSYTISDGGSGASTATVIVTVGGANDAPIAGPDTFRGYHNTELAVGVSVGGPGLELAGSLLANDADPDGAASELEIWPAGTFATSRGGAVTVQADGHFRYVPAVAPGVGASPSFDTFGYSVRDRHGLGSSALVTINLAPQVVWYVRADAPHGGDGRSTSPFRLLQSLDGPEVAADPDQPGSIIYVGCSAQPALAAGDGFNLEPGQQLVGGSHGLQIGGDTLAAPACANPVIEGGVVVADDTTIFGVDLGSSGSALASLAGSGVGVQIGGEGIDSVSIDNQDGKALDLSLASGSVRLASLRSANSPTQGIRLANVDADVEIAAGAISGAAGTDVEIVGGLGEFAFGGTISNTAGLAVNVAGRTGGSPSSVTFSGLITTIGAPGIELTDNVATTTRFTGGLTLNSGANAALVADNGGTVSVTGWANTIEAFGAPGLRIAHTTIAPEGLTFLSIGGSGQDRPGIAAIDVVSTGSVGRLAVAAPPGTPRPAGSGGSLTGYAGPAIVLRDTEAPALEGMSVAGRLEAVGVRALSIRDSRLNGVWLREMRGTSTIVGTTIERSFADDILWEASDSDAGLSVQDSTLGPTGTAGAPGNASLRLVGTGSATMQLSVVGSRFLGHSATGILASAGASASVQVLVASSAFSDNGTSIRLTNAEDADLAFDIVDNTFLRSRVHALWIAGDASTTSAARLAGFVTNNRIGADAVESGAGTGRGVLVDADGDVDGIVWIKNNTIRHTDQEGIAVRAFNTRLLGDPTPGVAAHLDVRIRDNDVAAIDDNSTDEAGDPTPTGSVAGILAEAADDTDVCLELSDNAAVGLGSAGIVLGQYIQAVFRLEGFMGDGAVDAEVEAYFTALNDPGTVIAARHHEPFVGVAQGTCRSF